ncbi:hypothetical protein [Salmonella phage SP01]|uniref:Uncharacterized protein n=1 Tax=Salmonella phage SP01 TaxID=1920294 RepID=A0A291NKW0_9CAUD|nr:hypothetical protein HOS12_gp105 [Salmonella phage SP01]ATI99462.1 hypothetical protein [Salmonella phage SP01]
MSKTVTVTMKDGKKFKACLHETDRGWMAYLPHLDSTGYGMTQREAIVDALNEASAGL